MRSTLDNLLGHLEKIQGANLGNLPHIHGHTNHHRQLWHNRQAVAMVSPGQKKISTH